jgi:WD40 repeat protein
LDDTVVVINTDSGEVARQLTGDGSGIWSVGWMPDGETLAGGTTDGAILFWRLDEVQEGRASWKVQKHLNWVSGISFSPDGAYMATSGADNKIVLTELENEKSYIYPGHSGVIRSVQFSPDGGRLVSGARDELVIIWDVEEPGVNMSPLAVFEGHTDGVNDVRWSPDGDTVASGSDDGTVILWPGVK